MSSGSNAVGASDQILRARPRIGLIAGALAFVVAAAFVIHTAPTIAWLAIAFFGAGALFEISQTLLGGARLQLGPDGFTIVNLWRARRYDWREVSAFGVFTFSKRAQPMVIFESAKITGPLAAANRALAGGAGSIPGKYGMDAAALAHLLNDRRADALSNGIGADPRS